MTAKAMHIISVRREGTGLDPDALALKPGVNVVVGVKDTGKTGWLLTISYLLGDRDTPEKGMGPALAAKFDSASVQIRVGDEEHTLQRRWKESGSKSKVFVGSEGLDSGEFSKWLLNKLGIPVLHYPKGNPWSGATWPELSWRELFRHVYREERFWSDLAPKQPETATHACLLQFLGAADKLYPKQLQEQIDQRKQLQRLQARREEFDEVLQEAVREIVPEMSSSGSLTGTSIEEAIARLNGEIDQQRRRRDTVLAELLRPQTRAAVPFDATLADQRVRLASEREEEGRKLAEVERRITELTGFRDRVKAELGRNQRTQVAGDLLSGLRVTCCPNCDQAVRQGKEEPGHCFVCHQLMPDRAGGVAGKRRLEFEAEQLRGEEAELGDLLGRLAQERDTLAGNIRRLDEQLTRVEAQLRPIRAAWGTLIPPEVAALDVQVGQIQERIGQLNRLRGAVALRDDLDRQIEQLQEGVQTLTEDLDAKYDSVDFDVLSEELSTGVNEYLDRLNHAHPGSWTHQRVRFELGKKPTSMKLLVGQASWTSVGATSTGFVLLGYHYALLRLTGRDGFNYPGIALIDFPMTFAKGMSVADKENYLIEPFVRLASEKPEIQVVVCGRAFKGLAGVNRVELTRVWEQGEAYVNATEEALVEEE